MKRLRGPVTVAENVTEAVQQINCGARRFHLREPIDLTVRQRGPYYFVGLPLEIEGYGHDSSESLESFADVFSTTWDAYAAEDDSRLSRDPRETKMRWPSLNPPPSARSQTSTSAAKAYTPECLPGMRWTGPRSFPTAWQSGLPR